MNKPKEDANHLMQYLEEHNQRKDRGMMAALRRGFSEATEDQTWSYLGRWCDLSNNRQRIIYQTVAAAYATHPVNAKQGNMGSVLRILAMGDGRGIDGLKSFDMRLRRFLTCDSAQEVCKRLPGIIRAAAQKGITINYAQLFVDLQYWGRRTRVEWASAYWGNKQEGGES